MTPFVDLQLGDDLSSHHKLPSEAQFNLWVSAALARDCELDRT